MPKRKSILMGAFIVFIIGGITMSYFNRIEEKRTEAQQIQHEQERMALYAYNSFKDVKKIEFTSFEKDSKTGTWDSEVFINEDYRVFITLWGFDGEITISGGRNIHSQGDYLKIKSPETNSTSLENINVIYWEEKNDNR